MTAHLRLRNILGAGLLCAVFALSFTVIGLTTLPQSASAAACTTPSTDYGTVSGLSVTISNTATYRIWSRMSAPDTSNDTYLLEVDGNTCYNVGGSGVPVYSSGATTYFANDSSNWINKTSSNTVISQSLSAGTHTLKLIGNSNGVVVDRIVFTQDTACVPSGNGSNCSTDPDVTPPVVSITSPATNGTPISTTTTITANATDNIGIAKVEFYLDNAATASGTDTTADASNNFTYSLNPTGLSPGTHSLTAKAYDTTGLTATSSTRTFLVPDGSNPTVSLTSPTAGATVSGVITASANATDNIGVTKVDFFVDGSSTATASDTTSPYSVSIDTTSLSNGTHSLTAKAYDAGGNVGTSTAVSISVNNIAPPSDTTPPTVAITAPTAGATISGLYTIQATASDASGITIVKFYVDNTYIEDEDTAPYSFSYDTTNFTEGTHTIKAVATDSSSNANQGTSASVTFTVRNVTANVADINLDGVVNFVDLSILASKYGQSGTGLGRSDINSDNIVNFVDLSILASNYGS